MGNIVTFWSNWERAHAALEPDAAWLASAGWTIPLWREPDIVRQLRETSGNLDSAFVRYYTAGKGSNLMNLWETLLTSRGLRRWRPLLSEAVASYRDRRYAIVVPALLLILEGAVALAAQELKCKRSSPKGSAARKREETDTGMRRLIWVSIEAFVKQVFVSAPFNDKQPSTLNRHWILHGRNSTTWARRRECIRLFHAIGTVAVTVDRIQ